MLLIRGEDSILKAESQAHADAVYAELQVLAEQEEALAPLAAVENKRLINLDG